MTSGEGCAGRGACQGIAVLLAASTFLSGCGTTSQPIELEDVSRAAQRPAPGTASRGGYYKNDGPGTEVPDIDRISDAEPRADPLHRFANNPYSALGRNYTPMRAIVPFKERGLASWYGRLFHGQRTSSGEAYDMYGMSAAHPTLPIPSYAKVTNLRNGRFVVVRVNDRGPFHTGRIIDLSFTAAAKLGYIDSGSAQVEVELIQQEDFSRYAKRASPAASVPIVGAPLVPAAENAPGSGVLFLQVGSFGARENAEALRTRLSSELAWLKEPVDVRLVDETYKVRVGPYRSRAEATSAIEAIRQALQITPLLVTR